MKTTTALACLLIPILSLYTVNRVLADDLQSISLSQAINMAEQNNASLLINRNSRASENLDVSAAQKQFLPNLSASVSSNVIQNRSYNSVTDQTTNLSNKNLNASIGAQINLFNGYNDAASLEKARLTAIAGEYSYEDVRNDLISNVVAQFVALIVSEEKVRITRENLIAQQQLLEQVEAMFAVGSKSVTDVLRQKADIAQSELALLTAEQNRYAASIQLSKTVGTDLGGELTAQLLPIEALIPRMIVWIDSMKTHCDPGQNPGILAQTTLVDAGQQSLRTVRSGYYPCLNASVNLSSAYNDNYSPSGFVRQLTETRPSLNASLTLSIPLFDRGVVSTGVEKARLQLTNQQITLRNMELNTALEFRNSLLEFATALKQRESAKAQFDYALQSRNVVQARYEVGAAAYTDLSQSRAQFVQASGDLVQADWNVLVKFFTVSGQTGTIDAVVQLVTNTVEN